jgi:putative DNA primase/helicase
VVDFTPAKLSSSVNFLTLASLDFWTERFPRSKSDGFDSTKAANWLISICLARGFYSSETVRGPGIWFDQGHTLVNTGTTVYADGDDIGEMPITKKHIYSGSERSVPDYTERATAEEVLRFYELLQCASWENESSAAYLLGWTFLAPLGANLQWRPHIWITGAAGAGKSYLGRAIGGVLPFAIWNQGTATEAGIRQEMGQANFPLVFEEADTDSQIARIRVASIIELIRNASDSKKAISRGTPSGKPLFFQGRFMAALLGIKVSLQHKQDRSRFTVLEMVVRPTPGFDDPGGPDSRLRDLLDSGFGERFFWRSANRAQQTLENIKIFKACLKKTCTARFADQHGSLLGAFYSAINDDVATPELAEYLVDRVGQVELYREEDAQKDESECFEHLLVSPIKFGLAGEKTVEDVFRIANGVTTDSGVAKESLALYGMAVVAMSGQQAIALHPMNPKLKKLFADTSWSDSKWKQVLKRLPGSEYTVQRIGGKNKKCICVIYKQGGTDHGHAEEN